jgi:hypothetical protein
MYTNKIFEIIDKLLKNIFIKDGGENVEMVFQVGSF